MGAAVEMRLTRTGRMRAVNKSIEERDRLVLSCLPLAFRLARDYRDRTQCLDSAEDVAGCALLILFDAAEKFDPARGVKFITYACSAIRQNITIELMKGSLIHVPAYVYQAVRERARGKTSGYKHGRQPIPPSYVDAGAAAAQIALHGGEPDCCLRLNRLESPPAVDLEPDKIGLVLERLPARDRFIVRECVMNGQTYAWAAEKLGICREYVRQLCQVALDKLRQDPDLRALAS